VIDRLAQLLRDKRIRRIICAPPLLDFDKIIDEGTILIISFAGLDKPLVRLLGTILFQGLQYTILERRKADRRDVAIYVDEFHNYLASYYSSENFQTLYWEGRRHLVALTIAHHDFAWKETNLLHTIHSTSSTIITFRCGDIEAQKMSRIFGDGGKTREVPLASTEPLDTSSHTISFLPNYEAIAKVGYYVHSKVNWKVVHFKTHPPPKKLRPNPYENLKFQGEDPPDPIEAHYQSKSPLPEEDVIIKDAPIIYATKPGGDLTLEKIDARRRREREERDKETPNRRGRKPKHRA